MFKLGSKGLFVFSLWYFCNYKVKTWAISNFKNNNLCFSKNICWCVQGTHQRLKSLCTLQVKRVAVLGDGNSVITATFESQRSLHLD